MHLANGDLGWGIVILAYERIVSNECIDILWPRPEFALGVHWDFSNYTRTCSGQRMYGVPCYTSTAAPRQLFSAAFFQEPASVQRAEYRSIALNKGYHST